MFLVVQNYKYFIIAFGKVVQNETLKLWNKLCFILQNNIKNAYYDYIKIPVFPFIKMFGVRVLYYR